MEVNIPYTDRMAYINIRSPKHQKISCSKSWGHKQETHVDLKYNANPFHILSMEFSSIGSWRSHKKKMHMIATVDLGSSGCRIILETTATETWAIPLYWIELSHLHSISAKTNSYKHNGHKFCKSLPFPPVCFLCFLSDLFFAPGTEIGPCRRSYARIVGSGHLFEHTNLGEEIQRTSRELFCDTEFMKEKYLPHCICSNV